MKSIQLISRGFLSTCLGLVCCTYATLQLSKQTNTRNNLAYTALSFIWYEHQSRKGENKPRANCLGSKGKERLKAIEHEKRVCRHSHSEIRQKYVNGVQVNELDVASSELASLKPELVRHVPDSDSSLPCHATLMQRVHERKSGSSFVFFLASKDKATDAINRKTFVQLFLFLLILRHSRTQNVWRQES